MTQSDDLFKSSQMSFGDHLDELRSTLIKSFLAIGIGFCIGLYFAGDFVQFISEPLKSAVDDHLLARAELDFIADLEKRKAAGEMVPENIPKAAEIFMERGLAPRQVLVPREQLNLPPKPKTVEPLSTESMKKNTGKEKAGEEEEAFEIDLVPLTIFEKVADDPRRIIGTGVTQGFMVYVKAALVLGMVLASPWVFYFIWSFVAAGLYPHEKSYVYVFLPFSLGLFLAGASLAFFVAVGFVLEFLFKFYAYLDIAPYPVINDWLGFILILPIGFGISFQLPLVMLFLERIGIFTQKIYLTQWRIAVVVICILSVFLTPADPGSMILMAVPLIILYFLGILLCRYMPKRKTPFGEMVEA